MPRFLIVVIITHDVYYHVEFLIIYLFQLQKLNSNLIFCKWSTLTFYFGLEIHHLDLIWIYLVIALNLAAIGCYYNQELYARSSCYNLKVFGL